MQSHELPSPTLLVVPPGDLVPWDDERSVPSAYQERHGEMQPAIRPSDRQRMIVAHAIYGAGYPSEVVAGLPIATAVPGGQIRPPRCAAEPDGQQPEDCRNHEEEPPRGREYAVSRRRHGSWRSTAANSATERVSPLRFGSIPARSSASRAPGIPRTAFQSVLRPCLNAACHRR